MFKIVPYSRRLGMRPFFMDDDFFSFPERDIASFRTDIKEVEGGYELSAELPGFKKEDLKINIDGDLLTIEAERREESEEEREGYLRRERRYGSFKRSFGIEDIDHDKIDAEYTDGILKLTLPKKEEILPQVTSIEIK
ncbi:MAG: Hsp20/alpha crystallin family protein [Clostridiales bacterium]|jgi:HSP20 family protein|nr:Hsp20/alpha crystallin family protein [Clostridiales bacterium]